MSQLRAGRVCAFMLAFPYWLQSAVATNTSARPAAIGFLNVKGSIAINSAQVPRHATVFEGDTIETGAASSEVFLPGVCFLRLAPNSRARVFKDRIALEQGITEVRPMAQFRVIVNSLQVSARKLAAVIRVLRHNPLVTRVSTERGEALVSRFPRGALQTVSAGKNYEFTWQAPAQQTSGKWYGCLRKEKDDERFILDADSGDSFELRPGDSKIAKTLTNLIGKGVVVIGRLGNSLTNGLKVIQVLKIDESDDATCKSDATERGEGLLGRAIAIAESEVPVTLPPDTRGAHPTSSR